jgi:hypothetical protein
MALELIEEEGVLSQDQFHEKSTKQAELLNIVENGELYWPKRSHETWLFKGDNKT